MGTLATAYAAAWVAITLYVSWLAIRNRRLAQRLTALESTSAKEAFGPQSSKAA